MSKSGNDSPTKKQEVKKPSPQEIVGGFQKLVSKRKDEQMFFYVHVTLDPSVKDLAQTIIFRLF